MRITPKMARPREASGKCPKMRRWLAFSGRNLVKGRRADSRQPSPISSWTVKVKDELGRRALPTGGEWRGVRVVWVARLPPPPCLRMVPLPAGRGGFAAEAFAASLLLPPAGRKGPTGDEGLRQAFPGRLCPSPTPRKNGKRENGEFAAGRNGSPRQTGGRSPGMKAAIHSRGKRRGRPFSPMMAASTLASTSTSSPRFNCCAMTMRAPEIASV